MDNITKFFASDEDLDAKAPSWRTYVKKQVLELVKYQPEYRAKMELWHAYHKYYYSLKLCAHTIAFNSLEGEVSLKVQQWNADVFMELENRRRSWDYKEIIGFADLEALYDYFNVGVNRIFNSFLEIYVSNPTLHIVPRQIRELDGYLKVSDPLERKDRLQELGILPKTIIPAEILSKKTIKLFIDLTMKVKELSILGELKTDKIGKIYGKKSKLKEQVLTLKQSLETIEIDYKNEKTLNHDCSLKFINREKELLSEIEKLRLENCTLKDEADLNRDQIENLSQENENLKFQLANLHLKAGAEFKTDNFDSDNSSPKLKITEEDKNNKKNQNNKIFPEEVFKPTLSSPPSSSSQVENIENVDSYPNLAPTTLFVIPETLLKKVDETEELILKCTQTIEKLKSEINKRLNSELFQKISNRHVVIYLIDLKEYIYNQLENLDRLRNEQHEQYKELFKTAELELKSFQAECNLSSSSLNKVLEKKLKFELNEIPQKMLKNIIKETVAEDLLVCKSELERKFFIEKEKFNQELEAFKMNSQRSLAVKEDELEKQLSGAYTNLKKETMKTNRLLKQTVKQNNYHTQNKVIEEVSNLNIFCKTFLTENKIDPAEVTINKMGQIKFEEWMAGTDLYSKVKYFNTSQYYRNHKITYSTAVKA